MNRYVIERLKRIFLLVIVALVAIGLVKVLGAVGMRSGNTKAMRLELISTATLMANTSSSLLGSEEEDRLW